MKILIFAILLCLSSSCFAQKAQEPKDIATDFLIDNILKVFFFLTIRKETFHYLFLKFYFSATFK